MFKRRLRSPKFDAQNNEFGYVGKIIRDCAVADIHILAIYDYIDFFIIFRVSIVK